MAPNAPGKDLRVGLVGYGLAGRVFHAPLIAATAGLTLDTVVTASPLRQDQVHAEHPGARTVAQASHLWQRAGDLDLVVVAAPNRAHVALATEALEHGLAVVVDKPLAATSSGARALAAMATERGVLLSVFQNRRWDSDFLTLRSLVDQGALGDLWRFESRFERWRPERATGWRESADPVDAGGVLYDLGSHLVDQALVLCGPAVSVYAEVKRRRQGAEVDDDSFVALEHANGALSHLWMSLAAAQHGPRFRALGSRAAYVKFGLDAQEAALRDGERPGPAWGEEPPDAWGWLGAGGALHDADPDDPRARRVPSLPGNYPAYYRAVVEAIRTSGPPPVGALEAADALTVIEAASTSAREHRVVSL